jgi:molybdate transport system substrate-binding protein
VNVNSGISLYRAIYCLVAIALVFTGGCRRSVSPAPLTVAAASDLTAAFEELGRDFESATKTKVVFVFGSTGMLTRQIENGAPFDLFAAANVSYIDELDQKGLIIPDSKAVYARGRITLWTTNESTLRLQGIEDLARPEVQRIAIANPDHAPYGLAAKQALQSAGVWDRVQPKLVYGDNIRQTLQYAQTGLKSQSWRSP